MIFFIIYQVEFVVRKRFSVLFGHSFSSLERFSRVCGIKSGETLTIFLDERRGVSDINLNFSKRPSIWKKWLLTVDFLQNPK